MLSPSLTPWGGSQSSTALDTRVEAAAPKTLLHFFEAPVSVPPFNLSLLGVPTQMSPVTERKNALLSLAPGSSMKNVVLPGTCQGARGSGQSSCSDSPMSLGSPAISSVGIALRICAWVAMPALFDSKEGSSDDSEHQGCRRVDTHTHGHREDIHRLCT